MTTVTFSTSGSWTAAASTVDCQCWAEGGNGGNGLTGGSSHSGGGGGGGEYAEETTLAVTNGTLYTFTIGQGGSSTNTSFPGDAVTVAAHYGGNGSGTSAGAKGTGSTNSIHFDGGTGGNGLVHSDPGGGGGGGGAGSGGAGGNGSAGGLGGNAAGGTGGSGSGGTGGSGGSGTSLSNPGNDGNTFGGGGGGGSGRTGGTAGGSGAAGQIVITYSGVRSGTVALSGEGTITAFGGPLMAASLAGVGTITAARAGGGYASLAGIGSMTANAQLKATASLSGTGTLAAYGAAPAPAVVNQWANSYGQGTTFTSITSALQSCVVPLNLANSVGTGSGTPSAGNWLFCIASWTQDPGIAEVRTGAGDDGHSWWREFPASSASGITRTSISYTPNITAFVQNVYVAPDAEIAAINVLVTEVSGLGPWDTVTGTGTAYDAASTSISLSLGTPAAHSFFIAATGGDNIASGQAFAPSGWTTLVTQTQTNGSNDLADNILTAAFLPNSGSSVSVSGSSSTAENVSGFLLGVYVTGTSPVPATQNPNWPLMVFEAGFGAGFNTPDSEITWTDLTSRMWDWEETTGIQFQLGQIQATNLTMHLDDIDGNLIPSNTASPYYPNVQPGTPVRLRAAIGTMGGVNVNRWYVIQRNATQWGEGIDEVYRRWCPVSGTDLWAALSSVPPTFYRSEVYEDAPYAWWPCDDQPGNSGVLPTQLLNAALGNTNPLNILLSPNGGALQQFIAESGYSVSGVFPPGIATYTVGADAGWMYGDPLSSPASIEAGNSVTATPGSAAWQTTGQAGSTGSFGWFLSCHDTSFPPLSGGVTVEVWFNYQFYGTANGALVSISPGARFSPYTQQPYNTPFTILGLMTDSAPVAVLQLDTSGHLNLITYNGGTGTSHSIYTASDLRSSSWHMITMTLTTTTWAVWLDGGANAQASGTATGMTSAWTWLTGNADFGSGGGVNTSQIVHGGNVALSHIAVYPYVLPYYRVLDHYWAAATAFGQLPAPTGVQVQWINQDVITGAAPEYPVTEQVFAPDGSPAAGGSGYPGNNGVSASAIVTATAPGVTSGLSAQATGTNALITPTSGNQFDYNSFYLWIGWTGLAPSFNVYTGNTVGTDNEAAVVNGAGVSFTAGYGNTATVTGVCKTAQGDGSAPPASASAVGDTVGQRIERLMRAGRVSSPNRCIDPAPLLVQAPGTSGGGQQVGASIQAIQESDSGLLYVDNQNNLTYFQKSHLASQYSSPVWQLGPTSPRIPYYKEIEWVSDPDHIYNAITVAPLSPTGASLPLITPSDVTDVETSQLRYGAQPLQVTSWLQSITEMQSQANFLFATYGTPRRHAENIKIDASGATPATLAASWQLVMGINVGDVVQIEDWVIGGGGPVYTYRVTEIQRHIEMGSGDNPVTTGSVTLTVDYEPTSYWS